MNPITEMLKTATYITATYSNGHTETVSRQAFESWLDIRDGRQVQTWDEYYAEDYVLSDLYVFIETPKTIARVMEPLNSILKNFAI